MPGVFSLSDSLGPVKVIHVAIPKDGVKGILVVDNVAAGPSIGGLRMASDVTLDECFRLARAMTLKNAAAGLPHGGGKSVMIGDPDMPREDKERAIRAFAHALRNETDYIFGPDIGTNEQCMAWVQDEIGRAVGLPREIGGIPLDELGAIGWGLAAAASVAIEKCDFDQKGARVAVQGFGSAGGHAARFLAEKGAILVAACDSRGATLNPNGLDIAALAEHKKSGRPAAEFEGGEGSDDRALVGVDCDIWIPAARPDALNADNVGQLKARLILQGANIPATAEAEKALHARGVINMPDFIANAGGVICAAMDYAGATRSAAFAAIWERIAANSAEVLERAAHDGVTERDAGVAMARERVESAMANRRFGVC